MRPGPRVWLASDGRRYQAAHARDRRCFGRLDGRWLGSVPAVERDLVSLETEELESLLQDARGRG